MKGRLDGHFGNGITLTTNNFVFDPDSLVISQEMQITHLREGGRVWAIRALMSGSGDRCTIWTDRIV